MEETNIPGERKKKKYWQTKATKINVYYIIAL